MATLYNLLNNDDGDDDDDFLYRKSVLCTSLDMHSTRLVTVPYFEAFKSIIILTPTNAAT